MQCIQLIRYQQMSLVKIRVMFIQHVEHININNMVDSSSKCNNQERFADKDLRQFFPVNSLCAVRHQTFRV